MKKIRLLSLIALVAILSLTGCTQQQRARNWGGTANEVLPPGIKLVTVAWKEDHLWLLTRHMTTNDVPETYEFKESSSWGLLQGTVIITESR